MSNIFKFETAYVEKDEFIKRFGNVGICSDIENEYGSCTTTQYIMVPNGYHKKNEKTVENNK